MLKGRPIWWIINWWKCAKISHHHKPQLILRNIGCDVKRAFKISKWALKLIQHLVIHRPPKQCVSITSKCIHCIVKMRVAVVKSDSSWWWVCDRVSHVFYVKFWVNGIDKWSDKRVEAQIDLGWSSPVKKMPSNALNTKAKTHTCVHVWVYDLLKCSFFAWIW